MSTGTLTQSLPYTDDLTDMIRRLHRRPHAFFLDSGLKSERGRYSILGCDPFDIIDGRKVDLLSAAQEKLGMFPAEPSPFPFSGGMVGAISYDDGRRLRGVASRHPDNVCGVLGCYDAAVVADHQQRQTHLISTGWPETQTHKRQARARQRLNQMMDLLSSPACPVPGPSVHPGDVASAVSREQYLDMIRRARQEIGRGEIYQVNLSHKFSGPGLTAAGRGLEIYAALRELSPSDFSAYFDAGSLEIISSSPERFLSFDGRRVETVPMKGTRRRGNDPLDHQRLKKELMESAKDQAELLMITDLMRSDLGRVCAYGSVRVTRPRDLEEYATVYQTTSTVEGVIRPGVSPTDILRETLPGGSITGCPKIRSMQIIDDLEPCGRGFYTGVLGYIGFDGRMDFSMLIRTVIASVEEVTFHAGAGIVADSDPDKEYEETLVKAQAMRQTIAKVQAHARTI